MGLSVSDYAIVAATMAGPIVAVQTQKLIERIRERGARKALVFQRLMATRAARLSPEHVQALNMIDLAFYGSQIFGINRRTMSEQAVIDAWREYLDHLNTRVDDITIAPWLEKGHELLISLLYAMAADVGYKFDRVHLKKGAYSPIAHGELEDQQAQLRESAIEVLSGRKSLKMEVTDFPVHPKAVENQLELQSKLLAAFEGRGSLMVDVKDRTAEEQTGRGHVEAAKLA
jgi:hypothetical protein